MKKSQWALLTWRHNLKCCTFQFTNYSTTETVQYSTHNRILQTWNGMRIIWCSHSMLLCRHPIITTTTTCIAITRSARYQQLYAPISTHSPGRIWWCIPIPIWEWPYLPPAPPLGPNKCFHLFITLHISHPHVDHLVTIARFSWASVTLLALRSHWSRVLVWTISLLD